METELANLREQLREAKKENVQMKKINKELLEDLQEQQLLSPQENKYLIGGPSTMEADSMLEGITNLSRVDDK